jgi:hypothetical protein
MPVFVRELSLKLTCLGQLCGGVGASHWRGRRWVRPRVLGCVSVVRSIRAAGVFVDDNDKTLTRGVIAPNAGVIGTAEPVVRGVEESMEHHGVWYTGEVPLGVAV